MARDAQQVHPETSDVESDLAGALGGVAVDQGSPAAGQLGRLVDRLDGAGLVVREHQADEGGVVAKRLLENVETDTAVVVDADFGQIPAVARQPPQRLEDRRMFG